MPQDKKTAGQSVSPINPESAKVVKPLTLDEIQKTLGGSGTDLRGGIINEEYNRDLSGMNGIKKFDEMRKSDASISALLLACSLPIRSTKWYIDPASDDDGVVQDIDREIADFVNKALFEKMETTWDFFLGECLTFLAFGFSLFEKVYTVQDDKVWIKKLAFRQQKSIEYWIAADGSPGIQQQLDAPVAQGPNAGKTTVSIPGDKLLLFSVNQEGDNYAGISILRPAYKHWYIKQNLEKFDAIRHQKQGVGVPLIYLPKNATTQDKEAAETIVKKFKTNEQSGIVMPGPKDSGRSFEFANLNAGDSTHMMESIKYHMREIVKTVLAQFVELGNTDTGSRSLGESQSDMFLNAIASYAKIIQNVINRYLIKELVDLNYNTDRYPLLKFKTLGGKDMAKFATTLSTLITAGVIDADEELQRTIREELGLPPKDQETSDDPVDEENNDVIDDEVQDDSDGIAEAEAGIAELETQQAELDTLDQELDDLGEFDEYTAIQKIHAFTDKIDDIFEIGANCFASIDQAHKDAISDALKEYWKKKGKKTGNDKKTNAENSVAELKSISDNFKKTISGMSEKMKQTRAAVKNAIADLKSSIPKNTKGMSKQQKAELKAKREAIKLQVSKMREELKANIEKMKLKLQQYRLGKKVADEGAKQAKKVVKDMTKKEKSNKANEHDGDCGSCLHDHAYMDISKAFNNRVILDIQKKAKDNGTYADVKKKGYKFNDFEDQSPRVMTFAERKVNFSMLKDTMEKYSSQLDKKTGKIFNDMKKDLMQQIQVAVDTNDVAAIGRIKAKFSDDFAQALTDVQKELFEVGKKAAATEMGVAVPSTPAETKGAMYIQNKQVVDKITNDITNTAQSAAMQTVAKRGGSITNTSAADVKIAVNEAVSGHIAKASGSVNTLGISMSLNMGRATIFEQHPEKVYAMQYSAILDDRTTDRCLSLDGRVVKPGSAAFYEYSPPQHYNCRSIWVEILVDEEFKPNIGGIPSSIEPALTIDNVPQMTGPVVWKGSPALGILQEELDDLEAKLEVLKVEGKYENRQKQYEDRIDVLKKALKK